MRSDAVLMALDAVDVRLTAVADSLAEQARACGRDSPFHVDTGIMPLCAAAVHVCLPRLVPSFLHPLLSFLASSPDARISPRLASKRPAPA